MGTTESIATGWEDIQRGVGMTTRGSANPPDWVQLDGLGNVFCLAFASNVNEDIHFEIQLPHSWKEGTVLRPHIHWTSKTGNAGDVVWAFEYTVASAFQTFPTTETVKSTSSNPGLHEHKITRLPEIRMNEETVSCMMLARLYRDTSDAADTLSEDAHLLEFDIHALMDSFGSGEEYIK